jgi:hypothetical protein
MADVLYVNSHSVTLYRPGRHGATLVWRLPNQEQSAAELHAALQGADCGSVSILVDLIEEEFRQETLPHALGRDRARLHQRQLGKLFRSTPFRHSRVIGRNREGRRDDRVLFSALSNPANLDPLLTVLNQLRIPVTGIYSLPIVSLRLLKRLGARSANVLIITEQPDGGLRETFVRNGQVQLSRLAPFSESQPADYCRIVTAEIDKTQRYLDTLRLLPRDESLEVVVLTDSARVEALNESGLGAQQMRFQALRLDQVAQLCGFRQHPDIPFSDALFSYLLHRHAIRNHYAQPVHLRHLRTAQLHQGLRAAVWLVAVAGAVLSGINLVESALAQRQVAQLQRLVVQINADYQRIAARLPMLPVDARAMREAVELAAALQRRGMDPDTLFRVLGSGFARESALALRGLAWFGAEDRTARAPVDAEANDQGSAQAGAGRFAIALVKGVVRRFDGDYRRAHQQIDALVAWLGEQPGITAVNVERRPLNTAMDVEVQGELAASSAAQDAEFELRIVMEQGHGAV